MELSGELATADLQSSWIAGGLDVRRLSVTQTTVDEAGLVGVMFRPTGSRPAPGIIVLPGAEGGVGAARGWAVALARRGYATLALAYFNAKTLPQRLEQVPLEYFKSAIDWFAKQPSVAADRIGIAGLSKGAEASFAGRRHLSTNSGGRRSLAQPRVLGGYQSTRLIWTVFVDFGGATARFRAAPRRPFQFTPGPAHRQPSRPDSRERGDKRRAYQWPSAADFRFGGSGLAVLGDG